ncbi:hypothetical protein C809_03099 [Lachnospiraceae bacterium MD335]|nr:hypothetical protein C809_03099 [Lachnospiraceae bacterium MD335]
MFIIQYQEVNIVITITTNRELAQSVIKAIQDSKISKEELLQKIELTEKEYDILLQKESFSIDDANKILKGINAYVSVTYCYR